MLVFGEQRKEDEIKSKHKLSEAKQEQQREEKVHEWEKEQIKKYNLKLDPKPTPSFIDKIQNYLFPTHALIQEQKYQNYVREAILDAMREEREYKELSLDNNLSMLNFFSKPKHEREKILEEIREKRLFQELSSQSTPPKIGYFGKPKLGFWDKVQSYLFPGYELLQELKFHNNKLEAYLKWKKEQQCTKEETHLQLSTINILAGLNEKKPLINARIETRMNSQLNSKFQKDLAVKELKKEEQLLEEYASTLSI